MSCEAGTAGTGGTCTPCTGNDFPSDDKTECITCPDGKEYSYGECIDCPRGTAGINGTCTPCSPGKTSIAGSSSCSNITCDPGKYLNINSNCTLCEIGTFSSGVNNNTSCTACPAGDTSIEGSAACSNITCPQGKYLNINSNCTECPVDTFSDVVDNRLSECTACPTGETTSNVTGSTNSNACSLSSCPSGQWVHNNECTGCGSNSYFDNNNTNEKGPYDNYCFDCPAGSESPSNAVGEISCICEDKKDTRRVWNRAHNQFNPVTNNQFYSSQVIIDHECAWCPAGEEKQDTSCTPCGEDRYKRFSSGTNYNNMCSPIPDNSSVTTNFDDFICDTGFTKSSDNNRCERNIQMISSPLQSSGKQYIVGDIKSSHSNLSQYECNQACLDHNECNHTRFYTKGNMDGFTCILQDVHKMDTFDTSTDTSIEMQLYDKVDITPFSTDTFFKEHPITEGNYNRVIPSGDVPSTTLGYNVTSIDECKTKCEDDIECESYTYYTDKRYTLDPNKAIWGTATNIPDTELKGTLDQCKYSCDQLPKCVGVMRYKGSGSDYESSSCYMKNTLDPTKATNNDRYDIYIKP